MAILAAIAFRNSAPVLGVALALSSAGDILLDLDPEKLFVYGLGLFLAVHLIYVFLFVQGRRGPLTVTRRQVVTVVVVLAYCVVISAWLLPSLGSLMAPVAIYMCAITGMVVTAVLAGYSRPGIVWGAMLFLASDSLLAVNKFKTPVPLRDYLVWATYYLGQYSIAIGFLNEKRKRKR